MAGFGKKNLRLTELRAAMIHAAAQAYLKEVENKRLLTDEELKGVVWRILTANGQQTNDREFDYATTGTKALMRERTYVQELASRWTRGTIGIGYDDMKRVDQILAMQTR
ncbi:MAG TPA: hypothetical protein VGB88_11040 [Alphaproteobacteria bacterium]